MKGNTMKLTILSNEEQKDEAVRAIVTAQHEMESMIDDGGLKFEDKGWASVSIRQMVAINWLSLCA